MINEDQKSASYIDASQDGKGNSLRASRTHTVDGGLQKSTADEQQRVGAEDAQQDVIPNISNIDINKSIQSFDKLVADMEGYLQNVRDNGFVVGEQLSYDQERKSSGEGNDNVKGRGQMRTSKDSGARSKRPGEATAKSPASPSALLPKSISLSKSRDSKLADGSRSRSRSTPFRTKEEDAAPGGARPIVESNAREHKLLKNPK